MSSSLGATLMTNTNPMQEGEGASYWAANDEGADQEKGQGKGQGEDEEMVQLPSNLFGFRWLGGQLHRQPAAAQIASETTQLLPNQASGLTWRARAVYAILVAGPLIITGVWVTEALQRAGGVYQHMVTVTLG